MVFKAFLAVALATASSGAMAQGFTGGSLGIEYNSPTDGSDFGGTTYSGGAEFAVTRDISLGFTAADYKFDNSDTDGSNLTLHGAYHLNDLATVGLFVAQDRVDGENSTIYGLEAGSEFTSGTVNGYFGRDTDSSSNLFGVGGTYDIQPAIGVQGAFDVLSGGDTDVSQITLGGTYRLASGPEFFAQVGNVNADSTQGSDNQSFIGLGARITFGAERGTTFGQRSIFEAIPGF